MSIAHGAVIYRQGDLLAWAFRVERGYVKLTRLNRDGDACMAALLKAGDWFGAVQGSSADGTESAVAKGAVKLRKLPVDVLRGSLADTAEVIDSMVRRQRFLELQVQSLVRADVSARLAAVLLDLATFCGRHCEHGHEIDVRLTHQELSEFSGVSRPVVTATLNQWRRQSLVRYTREYICIEQRQEFGKLLA